MGLYISGQREHSNSILSFSVENGGNLGDVVNAHPGWEILFGAPEQRGLALGLGGKTYAMDRIGGLVYNAEEPHHEYFHRPGLSSEALVIRREFLGDFLGEVLDAGSLRFEPELAANATFLENARQSYLALRGGLLENRGAKAVVESLVVDLLEQCGHDRKDVLRKISLSPSRLLLKELLAEIHARLDEDDLDLHELAGRLGVTRFHLIRVMKSVLGCTPYQYLRRLRLHRAERLLRATRLPITRIALDCGFADTSAFNKAFKSWKGVAPSRFRRG